MCLLRYLDLSNIIWNCIFRFLRMNIWQFLDFFRNCRIKTSFKKFITEIDVIWNMSYIVFILISWYRVFLWPSFSLPYSCKPYTWNYIMDCLNVIYLINNHGYNDEFLWIKILIFLGKEKIWIIIQNIG